MPLCVTLFTFLASNDVYFSRFRVLFQSFLFIYDPTCSYNHGHIKCQYQKGVLPDSGTLNGAVMIRKHFLWIFTLIYWWCWYRLAFVQKFVLPRTNWNSIGIIVISCKLVVGLIQWMCPFVFNVTSVVERVVFTGCVYFDRRPCEMRVEFEFSTYLKTRVLFSYALSIFKYFSEAIENIWGMIFILYLW